MELKIHSTILSVFALLVKDLAQILKIFGFFKGFFANIRYKTPIYIIDFLSNFMTLAFK